MISLPSIMLSSTSCAVTVSKTAVVRLFVGKIWGRIILTVIKSAMQPSSTRPRQSSIPKAAAPPSVERQQRGFYRHDNRIKGRQSVVADQTGAQDAHFFKEVYAVVRSAIAAKTDITAGFQKRRRFGEAVVDEIGKGTMNELYPVFGIRGLCRAQKARRYAP